MAAKSRKPEMLSKLHEQETPKRIGLFYRLLFNKIGYILQTMRELTAKQAMFVQEYLIDLNATQAAIRSGYSKKTAEWIGPQLLTKNHVSAAIQAAKDDRAKRVLITADDVIQSIIDIRAMAIRADKLNEALKANELLGKHLVLFTDKLQSDVNLRLKELPAKIDEFL